MDTMNQMPPELEQELEAIVPNFVKSVERAKAERAKAEGADVPIILTIHAFANEPELAYACIAYASGQGVSLLFAPTASSD